MVRPLYVKQHPRNLTDFRASFERAVYTYCSIVLNEYMLKTKLVEISSNLLVVLI